MTPLLDISGLRLAIPNAGRPLPILRDIHLTVATSEILGIIGESGSGKTMMGMSLLRLEPATATLDAQRLALAGTDLLRATPSALQSLRGATIGMIFQDPVGAFNPAKRIAWHARAVLRRRDPRAPWREPALAQLAQVDIADGPRTLDAYPHQLSGGMLQRVLIALVLAARPLLVIADEPTTNLDNIVEQQILGLFRKFRQTDGTAFIFITHDMTVAASLADRIAVMYAGEIIETGPTAALFTQPLHPYTTSLIATARALQSDAVPARLPELQGEPPALSAPRPGCAFAARCPHATASCTATPIPMLPLQNGREVRCILHA